MEVVNFEGANLKIFMNIYANQPNSFY